MGKGAKKLLITGCGRSGTGFLAKVLRECGIPATHERLFNPKRSSWPEGHEGAESSWLAAPFLKKLPKDVTVFHQIRHPFDVIRSLVGFGFFNGNQRNPYQVFAFRHAPGIRSWKDSLDRSMSYWVFWNLQVERYADVRYQVESLTPKDLREHLLMAGFDIPASTLQEAFSKVGTRYNSRARAKLQPHEILKRPLAQNLRKLARKYGYEVR